MPLYTLSQSPLSVPGLTFWVDASDPSTVGLSESNYVVYLEDKITGKRLTSNTDSPIYTYNSINNKNSIYFDYDFIGGGYDIGGRLGLSNLTMSCFTPTHSIYFVANPIGNQEETQFLFGVVRENRILTFDGAHNSPNIGVLRYLPNFSIIQNFDNDINNGWQVNFQRQLQDNFIISCRSNATQSAIKMESNRSQQNEVVIHQNVGYGGGLTSSISIGDFQSRTYSATAIGWYKPYRGYFGEMLFYDRYLSDDDHYKVLSYLRNKWISDSDRGFIGITGLSMWVDASDVSTVGLTNIGSVTASTLFIKDKISGRDLVANNMSSFYNFRGVNNKGSISFGLSDFQTTLSNMTMSLAPGDFSLYFVCVPNSLDIQDYDDWIFTVMNRPLNNGTTENNIEIKQTFRNTGSNLSLSVALNKSVNRNFNFSSLTHPHGINNTSPCLLTARVPQPLPIFASSSIVKCQYFSNIGPTNSIYNYQFFQSYGWWGESQAQVVIGRWSSATPTPTGFLTSFCEVLWYNRVLSDDENMKVVNYLQDKWMR